MFSPAVGLIVAYALLGSTWLIMKTEGALQQRSLAGSDHWPPGGIAIVSIWTPLAHPEVAARWFVCRTSSCFRPCRSWSCYRRLPFGFLQEKAHAAPFAGAGPAVPRL